MRALEAEPDNLAVAAAAAVVVFVVFVAARIVKRASTESGIAACLVAGPEVAKARQCNRNQNASVSRSGSTSGGSDEPKVGGNKSGHDGGM